MNFCATSNRDLPFVLNVLVNTEGQSNGSQREVPAGDEHEDDTQCQTNQGQDPVGGDKVTHGMVFTECQTYDQFSNTFHTMLQ